MRILATNDDGILAEGLRVLAEELSGEHDVFVVAPDQERSGVSHAMSLRSPGRLTRVGEGRWSCSGTPADCVILAGLGAISGSFDLVVSGINRGPNLGTDIVYSGTCGAARQAALGGVPGIALSCASYREPFHYLAAADFVRRNLEALLAALPEGCFININAPSVDGRGLRGRWAGASRRQYRDRLSSFEAPDGSTYCFLTDTRIESSGEAYNDAEIVAAGEVSISLVLAQPAIHGRFKVGETFA
jgi:5'-nucleotidase